MEDNETVALIVECSALIQKNIITYVKRYEEF